MRKNYTILVTILLLFLYCSGSTLAQNPAGYTPVPTQPVSGNTGNSNFDDVENATQYSNDSCGRENQQCCKGLSIPDVDLKVMPDTNLPVLNFNPRRVINGLLNLPGNIAEEQTNSRLEKVEHPGTCNEGYVAAENDGICTCVTKESSRLLSSLNNADNKTQYLAQLQKDSTLASTSNSNVLGDLDNPREFLNRFSLVDIDKTQCLWKSFNDLEKAKCLRCAPLSDPEEDKCIACFSGIDPDAGLAAEPGPGTWTALGCIRWDFEAFINENVFDIGIGIGGVFALLCIIYSAFILQTAANNPERIQQAQERMISCILGLIIIIFSIFIMNFIGANVLRIPEFLPVSP